MPLDPTTVAALAAHLAHCERTAQDTPKITDEHPGMDWHDAYLVQAEIGRLHQARGARIAGLKAGFTSLAKMRQMGVDTPIFGFVTDEGAVPDGGEVDIDALIHPKVEPEIVFVMKHALRGPGCHMGAVLAATDFILPGIEVIDSRYRDFKFDLTSVIADNTSAARYVLGGQPSSAALANLRGLGVVMEKNGQVVSVGAAAAVMGHPAIAVAMLANHLAERGEEIPAGGMVLSGGITEAVAVQAGDHIQLRIQDLGSVSLRFVSKGGRA